MCLEVWILESCSRPTCTRRSRLLYLQIDKRKPYGADTTFCTVCTVPQYEHHWAFNDISLLPTAWFTLVSVTLCI